MIRLLLAGAENERRSVLAGGALCCAFAAVYLSHGFYFQAVVLLWLLILRGIGAEFRSRVESASWRRVLDISLGLSSLLLVVGLGAAVGCVIRGVPPTSESRILNWFPLLCGISALACLTLQSAAWTALKSSGDLQARCRGLASRVWWAVLLCYAGVTAASCAVQPHLLDNLWTNSWISLFAVAALAGLIGTRLCLSVGFDLGTFASASCLIAGLLASVAAGIYHAGSAHLQLSSSATWWMPALLPAVGYNVRVHRVSEASCIPTAA